MGELVNSLAKWIYKELLGALTQPAGGIGIIETLGSGYSVEGERMANVEKLRARGIEVVTDPAYAPRDGKTFCNLGARFVAEEMGYFGLPANGLANDLIAFLSGAPGWAEDTMERAHAAALKGGLAFVGLVDHPHGHIAALAPEPMEPSGSWGEEVPLIFNVGKTNGMMRLSQAFKAADRPSLRFFIWEDSIA